MARQRTGKAAASHYPSQINEARDAQLLQVFSKPNSWVQSGVKPSPLRTTARKRGRLSKAAGFFDAVPHEILNMILLNLDYLSLAKLCTTNSKVAAYIKRQPFYKLVVEYCHNTLRSMAMLDLHRAHDARHVYKALVDPKCSAPGCKKLGNSLFLPNCRRSCLNCLGRTPISTALVLEAAINKYGLSKMAITENILCFKLPNLPEWFVVAAEAIDLATRLYGRRPVDSCLPLLWSEMATVPFPFLDPDSRRLEFGRQCRACYMAYVEHRDIWTQIEIPPTDSDSKNWEMKLRDLEERGLAVFGIRTLLSHVRSGDCPEATVFWSQEIKRL
ncbi:hypothetical protein Asppvi_008480 [Aspergillus pseudoviridinutans]|uniref:F-box domain-containing protein n=1 Tax=Aspergillus pseudoviridinutans TaxID=1517512 RepID=A0A9P3BJL3_9EURO|nr:uncharacterized protein Asppvi_008480 [Aspergillus pseudoviridinutans]GIJ89538.1 hypothetical protein Asppvi_008480 [Aspergillus pseudoviridinutans]